MIARIHHNSVKIEILRLSHNQSLLSFDGSRISIFPDFPVEVSTQCKQFDSVQEKLRAKGIKYRLLYPARLILMQYFRPRRRQNLTLTVSPHDER